MQRRKGPHACSIGLSVLTLILAGCMREIAPTGPVATEKNDRVALPSTDVDAIESGKIQGRVVWQGQRPQVPPLDVMANPGFLPPWPVVERQKSFPNPNAPAIHSSGGVAGAVVFVQQVDATQCRPWRHGDVTVAFKDSALVIEQGGHVGQTGFIRTGASVQFISHEKRYHAVRGRLADFFSLTLPDPHQPRSRKMVQRGVVELSSAADYYWLRGYLFVDDHPYYTRTDAEGQFTLEHVPPGQYQLVAWLPNWTVADHHRNPEAMMITRLSFLPPVERTQPIHVETGQTANANFTFRTDLFQKGLELSLRR